MDVVTSFILEKLYYMLPFIPYLGGDDFALLRRWERLSCGRARKTSAIDCNLTYLKAPMLSQLHVE